MCQNGVWSPFATSPLQKSISPRGEEMCDDDGGVGDGVGVEVG
jgi:hypothetical protein